MTSTRVLHFYGVHHPPRQTGEGIRPLNLHCGVRLQILRRDAATLKFIPGYGESGKFQPGVLLFAGSGFGVKLVVVQQVAHPIPVIRIVSLVKNSHHHVAILVV